MTSPSYSLPYIRRHLEAALKEALADTPVVCILGLRQCGKSTLAQHVAPQRAYVTLDDPNSYELARHDPKGFIGELPEYVTIDEVQRAPELALAIKQSVDSNRKPGRFQHKIDPCFRAQSDGFSRYRYTPHNFANGRTPTLQIVGLTLANGRLETSQ